jgi:type II secretory pathway pseudopilin PulG
MRSFQKQSRAGFSLVEIQMAVAVLILIIGVAAGIHFFGLRMFMSTKMTLEATDDARNFIGGVRDEVRSCTIVLVGKGDFQTFSEIPDETPQIGNALQIFPQTNLNRYVIYFHDSDNTLKRWSTDNRKLITICENVTNRNVFAAQDFSGNVLTNNENNRVIEVTLKFLQEHTKDAAKKGGLHNYYQAQTKITRRKVL